jgi:acetyltransferase-like isoleucine patch superfamily enzyme
MKATICNTELGNNCNIEDSCEIGKKGKGKTIIGENANIRSFSIIYPDNKITD